MNTPFKCVSSGCSATLAYLNGQDLHIDLPAPTIAGTRIRGVMQASSGCLTIACPACGTLNLLKPGSSVRGLEELLEKTSRGI